MAEGKRKSPAGSKGSAARGKTGAKKMGKTSARKQDEVFAVEIILWMVVAVSVLLFISNFGVGGKIGNAVSSFFFGVFGMLAYIFPVVFLVGTFFAVSNRGSAVATVKIVAGFLFVAFLCMFIALAVSGDTPMATIESYHYSKEHKKSGGIIGGFLLNLIMPNFGVLGSYVIDIVILIISLVLLTERSALRWMEKGSRKVYESAKYENERHREYARIRREERELLKEEQRQRREEERQKREEQARMYEETLAGPKREIAARRMDKKASGVSVDITIVPEQPKVRSDDINEISIEDANLEMPQIAEALRIPVEPVIEQEPEQITNTIIVPPILPPDANPAPFGIADSLDLARLDSQDLSAASTQALSGRQTREHEDLPQGVIAHTVELSPLGHAKDSMQADDGMMSDDELERLLKEEMTGFGYAKPETPKSVYEETGDALIQRANQFAMEDARADRPETAAEEHVLANGNGEQSVWEMRPGTETEEIEKETAAEPVPPRPYLLPSPKLLKKPSRKSGDSKQHLKETAMKLQQTLKNFGVNVTITNISCGPSVTRYELSPEMGVKVHKIVNLTDDIKLNLAATDIRMEAPIPGKAAIGIEVPNKETVMVSFRELVESEEFQSHASKIAVAVGRDIGGNVVVTDIAKMPHLLIAGATGAGKSVCINTIIMSILYKAKPNEVKLIMIDPKVVELSVYNGIPHLLIPVVTDPKKAAGALNWAVAEMTERYNKFAACSVRDFKGYNAKIDELPEAEGQEKPEKMTQIVIIVDELADLMMVASSEVEAAICRLAQLARAAGIHLIIATQRPSVNVITGLIKANMPSRIAFAVTSGIDSRTILDMVGAEKLLGKGDMLFSPQGAPKPVRVQGAFVSDKEVNDVVGFIKEENGPGSYSSDIQEKVESAEAAGMTISLDGGGNSDGRDAHFAEAAKLLIDKEKASIGMLQRYFKIGFNRAARIMDQLEEAGVVGPEEGTKPRQVLMTQEQFETYVEECL